MTRSFLICGISDDQYPVLFGDKAEDVKARITTGLQAAEKQFVDAGCSFKLVKLAPVEADVAKWEQHVSQAHYDGIVIGVCYRQNFPAFLQSLVNSVIAKSPSSKLLFNTGPEDTFDTAKGVFPDIA